MNGLLYRWETWSGFSLSMTLQHPLGQSNPLDGSSKIWWHNSGLARKISIFPALDWESATTSTRLFRDISWREYIPGKVRSECTVFRRNFNPIPRRLAADASVLMCSWGADFRHSMQHLVQERRKTKPPKAPQREQFSKQRAANNTKVDIYRAAPVLRKARNASKPYSMMSR